MLLPATIDRQLVHLELFVHRAALLHDYSEFLLHVDEFQSTIRTVLSLVISSIFCQIIWQDIATHCNNTCGTPVAQRIRIIRTCLGPNKYHLIGSMTLYINKA